MSSQLAAAFTNRRIGALLVLGFASGLPLALTHGTLQAWLTVEGLDIKTIGFFTLVGQAYVFKFLWAPLMDRFAPRIGALGRRRGWLVLTQLGLIASIAALGSMQPRAALVAVAAIAVVVAFASASQDIVFDAYRTDLLPPAERGAGAAVSVLGYRVAMLVSGGLALFIADRWLGWQYTYWLMSAIMGIGLAATVFLAPEPALVQTPPKTIEAAILGPLRNFFSRERAVAFLALIVLYKLGDAFAGALTTTFLIRGIGFSAGEVGLVNKTLGLVATVVGVLYGGALMSRLGLYRSLLVFGVAQMLSNLAYWAIAVTPKSLVSMAIAVGVENLCGGMATAAFVALLMALCDRSFSATQFALLSALASFGRVYVGPVSGITVEAVGWAAFFLATVVAAAPGVGLLVWMRRPIDALDRAPEPAAEIAPLRTNPDTPRDA